ncbi:GNAT family acetyltransferase [Bacillus paranthracis]|uniref:hypothetical protein n=1 Tax=Bacillus cereus group TaxID=86661 RepID=UPI000200F4B2|nr:MULTISPECIES: hypothetical protein [Bacillus cereus group]ADY22689.1 hypothetical protein YBT020_17295 [Bacillus thuringiensis serovar finitimus YBT-020]MRC71442.1 GNAT family acetyltransferase [Bacillus thuringiensis]OTX74890.1 GNAT family acetyltransferase [Bacillus thuringiensis serovar finitimus]MCR6797137.1 GNAT family acetyltransferase [Bacillus paranthracis]MEC3358162.1 GNAT family acetyltransferase [Bacillus paranthracis]
MIKSSNENNLVIEKYSKNNELQVKQLIDLYNEESYVFHLLRDNKTKCAYIAYYKKDVVGIFFTWGSNFHPYCTYFRIYTNPFYAELHIEEFLLNEIQKRENFKLPLQTWQEMILADDVLLDGSFLIIDEEHQIMAYSFLHTSEKDNTVELGWCGTHTKDDLSLLKLLVFEQFMYANKHGYSFIQGEFDSTSIYAMEILKSVPFNPCATWITYQKEIGR